MRPRIAVAGSVAQRAGHGGHAWVFLQYLLGFRRLGYDVLFVADGQADDRTSAELSVAEKDAISHRGKALRAIAPVVADVLTGL